MNNVDILKQRIKDHEQEEENRTICILELPFAVEESTVAEYFKRCDGGVRRLEITRSAALVFSSAYVEFNNHRGRRKALRIASRFAEEYEVIIVTAEDFMDDRIPTRQECYEGPRMNGCFCM
ncbi:U4/U6 snRNA-associated-splicing factor PRP24 [Acrasis kona]|uniref:U4/U6 snRNA-associated-splicing factor PRP24 n=1 Tax=Acrasis kona TaxID=1008807 RepID=A0AAW2ZHB9_9EUKA